MAIGSLQDKEVTALLKEMDIGERVKMLEEIPVDVGLKALEGLPDRQRDSLFSACSARTQARFLNGMEKKNMFDKYFGLLQGDAKLAAEKWLPFMKTASKLEERSAERVILELKNRTWAEWGWILLSLSTISQQGAVMDVMSLKQREAALRFLPFEEKFSLLSLLFQRDIDAVFDLMNDADRGEMLVRMSETDALNTIQGLTTGVIERSLSTWKPEIKIKIETIIKNDQIRKAKALKAGSPKIKSKSGARSKFRTKSGLSDNAKSVKPVETTNKIEDLKLDRAKMLRKAGLFNEAGAEIEDLMHKKESSQTKNDGDNKLAYNLATVKFAQGNMLQAIDTLNKAAQQADGTTAARKYDEALIMRARIRIQMKDFTTPNPNPNPNPNPTNEGL